MAVINLDYASHTSIDERVLAEFCRVEREFAGNVMSAHSAGRRAMAEMERVTSGIAGLLGVSPQGIIFTSGASEANNLAIKGIAKAYEHEGRHILSTCLEHPSVSGALSALQLLGWEIELLKILPNGAIDFEHLKTAIRRDTVLLCISAVDSELGAVQPIAEIVEILEAYPRCHLHVDAAQAVGKIDLRGMHCFRHCEERSDLVSRHGADSTIQKNASSKHLDCFGESTLAMTDGSATWLQHASTFCFSPHKFYGPCGVGVLVKREDIVLEPLIHGGGSTTIYRSGTPALSLAAAAYMALQLAFDEMDERLAAVGRIREYVLEGLKQFPLVRINSPVTNTQTALHCEEHLRRSNPEENCRDKTSGLPRSARNDGRSQAFSPYILNISVAGIKGTDFQAALDRHGICVSVKSACSTDRAPSRPVFAVSRDKKNALCSWRVSFSHLTTMQEIDAFLSAFEKCYKELSQ